ncbi:MAG: hypothetical protein JRH15_21040 [Deltaproteobacteria bacterium]|nr:hypothetical protein [Deltaproteobacteria bacterium]
MKQFMSRSLVLSSFLLLILLLPVSVLAIPSLGVAPGDPTDPALADVFFDGFPMSPEGGEITIWYGSDSGEPAWGDENDIWLLTTSANGDKFKFAGYEFKQMDELSVASYKAPVYGVNLTEIPEFTWRSNKWTEMDSKFYSYEFGEGGKKFYGLTGMLECPGMEPDDWMYVVLEGNSIDGFSPKTTSSYATPIPPTLLLLGSGLIGLAGFRKKFNRG